MKNRIPLYYTFGNHMHWVDLQWLWGYDVLPSSVRDMLHLCVQTNAKGNINFDAIGYEKMAAEAPDALAQLRAAVQAGQIEVVGASYGQPYGLFHGGESNIRQRVYGVRTVQRLLGTKPRTFWEEEFDFFPQLPQILTGAGYEFASLFFQWTWHTPHIPQEKSSVIWWEGMDGSRLLTAPRNALNLYPRPEAVQEALQGILTTSQVSTIEMPAIVQWLELMPADDWSCRSQLLLPAIQQLFSDARFEVLPVTLSEFLQQARQRIKAEAIPVRRYAMNEVFHGVSLGKNGDRMRRMSRRAEQSILTAESLSAMVGFLGRPNPSWDLYPVWELEEAWRDLMVAQHHDNDSREGLCGFIGLRSYERSLGLSDHITRRTLQLLTQRTGETVVYNPLGWVRDAVVDDPVMEAPIILRNLPPFGYRTITNDDRNGALSRVEVVLNEQVITLRRGPLSVSVDRVHGVITQMVSADFPEGLLRPDLPLAAVELWRNGEHETFDQVFVTAGELFADTTPFIEIGRQNRSGAHITIRISLAAELDAVDIAYTSSDLPRPDGRMQSSLQTSVAINLANVRYVHDHPYGLSEIQPTGTFLKKYPTGDWATSPQVFEEVHNPFTALQLLDFHDDQRGLLLLHDGNQAFLRDGDVIRHILSMYDPWDEAFYHTGLNVRVRLVPHGKISNTQRWQLAQEFTCPALLVIPNERDSLQAQSAKEEVRLPQMFQSLRCDTPNVAITAFYREGEWQGIDYPYVIRLVEFDGTATEARLRLPGRVLRAAKTNLLGEIITELTPICAKPDESIDRVNNVPTDGLRVSLRPFEIATLYLELELGHKQMRKIEADQNVWAMPHHAK